MNGTEWTEPGQGATVWDLMKPIHSMIHAAAVGNVRQFDAAHDRLHEISRNQNRNARTIRTNLRLTGAPLTADDLRRIAKCK